MRDTQEPYPIKNKPVDINGKAYTLFIEETHIRNPEGTRFGFYPGNPLLLPPAGAVCWVQFNESEDEMWDKAAAKAADAEKLL